MPNPNKANQNKKIGRDNPFLYWGVAIIIAGLIIAQTGILAGQPGWAKNIEVIKEVIVINRSDIVLQTMLDVSTASLQQGQVFGWMQFTAGEISSEATEKQIAEAFIKNFEKQMSDQNSINSEHWMENRMAGLTMSNYTNKTDLGEIVKITVRKIALAGPTSLENDNLKNPNIKEDLKKLKYEESIYLLVEVSQIKSIEKALLFRQQIAQSLEQTGLEYPGISRPLPKTALNLVTSLEGKLDHNAQAAIINQTLQAVGAGSPEGLIEPNLISITAYAPRLSEYQMLAGKKVNLQIASRYHSLDNQTYFHIGIPLLMIEY